MTDVSALIVANAARWAKMQILSLREHEVERVAAALVAPKAKAIYQQIEQATGVPWFVVAVIHEREANQNFSCSIAQGDPWNRPSVHAPKGRGPFNGFIPAAIDALTNCAPYAARWTDWSIGGALTLLEEYNGLGYEDYHHEPSPYDWGATSIEQEGKYVADGRWSATVWDTQIGCAAMLKAMMAIDTSISFVGDVPKPVVAPPKFTPPGPKPMPQPEVAGDILDALRNLITVIKRAA